MHIAPFVMTNKDKNIKCSFIITLTKIDIISEFFLYKMQNPFSLVRYGGDKPFKLRNNADFLFFTKGIKNILCLTTGVWNWHELLLSSSSLSDSHFHMLAMASCCGWNRSPSASLPSLNWLNVAVWKDLQAKYIQYIASCVLQRNSTAQSNGRIIELNSQWLTTSLPAAQDQTKTDLAGIWVLSNSCQKLFSVSLALACCCTEGWNCVSTAKEVEEYNFHQWYDLVCFSFPMSFGNVFFF